MKHVQKYFIPLGFVLFITVLAVAFTQSVADARTYATNVQTHTKTTTR